MINSLFGTYRPRFATVVVYMLQATEYQVLPYLKWFWRTTNFNRVIHRRNLILTRPARLLLSSLQLGLALQYIAALIWLAWAIKVHSWAAAEFAIAALIIAPILWAHLMVIPLLLGRWLIIGPYYGWQIRRSAKIFAAHPATKIAVAGSYGKTTMKEILLTVLGEAKKVAATPANRNVSISHAIFVNGLKGDEEILIIEYGEGAPGDVKRFAQLTRPNFGIITGLAPAHLDRYKTVARAGKDIFALAGFLKDQNTYVNKESEALLPFIKPSHLLYDSKKAAGWAISDIKTTINGLSFTMKKATTTLKIKSQLLGRHQVGPLALAAALAHKFGLTKSQIGKAVAKIEPFEHRMQPRSAADAWIIDDTYNGNIEGMKAGLALLKELKAKRKIYVTPGLVDQGKESRQIHQELGEAIVKAKPDLVILMKHSVTQDILDGISGSGFNGELVVEEDPLNFYIHLDQFVAAGDLVLLQNDWPDNYN